VDAATGIITTVAGNGIASSSGDGGPATSASVAFPIGVAVDPQGNIFVTDSSDVVRRVDAGTGIITTVAGNGTSGFSGDGGPATSASLKFPEAVAVDPQDDLFIADFPNQRIRRVDGTTGIISTVAGNGTSGFSGDGGPAISAELFQPWGVALDAHGNLFIADEFNGRIRRVDAVTGIITTVAGDGDIAHSGDGGQATSAGIGNPFGVAVDAQGNIFISAGWDVRRVDAVAGIISTVAGQIPPLLGFSGDGGPATSAGVRSNGLVVDAEGRLFIADAIDNRVRVVPLPPFVALAPAALSFSSQAEGTTSAAQIVTLTNSGLVPLTISGIAIAGTNAGDYAQTNTCGSSLGAGASCAINVTFTPSETGSSTAALTIADNAPGSPQSVPVSGTAQVPDFTLAVSGSPASATVSAGETATYKLSITPQAGLSGTVGLTCSGVPLEATCTVNPASLNLSGPASVPVTVTVSTTARSAIWLRPKPPAAPWIWGWFLAMLSALGATRMCGHRFTRGRAWTILGAGMLGFALLAGCGGSATNGGAGGTPAGTYTLTVTGSITSGATLLQHNVALTLTVD
jgi:sugar lactone lactonase YvrE